MEMDKRPHKERYDSGLKTRTEVLGREWVEKSMAGMRLMVQASVRNLGILELNLPADEALIKRITLSLTLALE